MEAFPLLFPNHYSKGRFYNPYARPIRGIGFWRLLKWQLQRKRPAWPDYLELPQPDCPPQRMDGASIRVSFVGHACFLIQTEGLNLLTDPIWSERASPFSFLGPKRVTPPGIALKNLPPIDAVLLSHSHYDHLDVPTLRALAERQKLNIFCGLGLKERFEKKIPRTHWHPMDWGHTLHLSPQVHLTYLPAQHWSSRTVWDKNRTLWGGFYLKTPKKRIYFSGDTGYCERLFSTLRAGLGGPLDLAFLPIGAYSPYWFMHHHHTNPEEAVRIHQLLEARQTVAFHFGTFCLSDEAYDKPARDLQAALEKFRIPSTAFLVPQIGQPLYF